MPVYEEAFRHIGRRDGKVNLLTDGFADLEAAFAAADAELGEAPLGDTEETMPVSEVEAEVGDEQALEGQDEQPDVAETTDEAEVDVDAELQDLVDEIGEDVDDVADDESDDDDPVNEFLASDDFWSTEIELDLGDGPEVLTTQELVDGYLRQADYTRKTQGLADERGKVEDAAEFYRVFEEDPLGFARALAVKANLIEAGAEPVRPLDVAKFTSPEEFEAEIERRVEERFESDPRFAEAQMATARSQADQAFNEIESERSITLSPEARQHLIDLAVRSGTTDLRQVLDAEMYRRSQARKRAAEKKRNAPSRPSKGSGPTSAPTREQPVADIDEAFERALAEVG